MFVTLFAEASDRINSRLVTAILYFLAISRYGLRSNDLAAIFGKFWSPLSFAHLINYISDCFMVRSDGRIDFMHKSMREGLQAHLPDDSQLQMSLFTYLSALPENDILKQKEYLYHCMKVNKRNLFADYIDYIFDDEGVPEAEFETYLENAADCVKSFCLQDEGQWLKEELEGLAAHSEYSGKICDFIDYLVYLRRSSLMGSQTEIAIAVRLLEASLILTEKMRKDSQAGSRV